MPSYPFNAADGLCAGAAQAAALCTLVIRGAQGGLTKAVSHAASAEHALSNCIKCSGRASLPAEGSRSSPCLRATWRLRTPTQCGRSGWTQEVPDPYGGSEASAVDMELPFLRDTWRLRTHPQAGNGSGAVGLVREEPNPWGLTTPSFSRNYG